MFTYAYTVRLHDTDAAGQLYFASALRIAHEAYEALMASIGFALADLLTQGPCLLPIVHAEADYLAPLTAGASLEVDVSIAHIGATSFHSAYRLRNAAGTTATTARLVHVAIDPQSRQKITLPATLRQALTQQAGCP